MAEERLNRVVLVIVKCEDFRKVRELLETEEIEFFVNDPMLRFSRTTSTGPVLR